MPWKFFKRIYGGRSRNPDASGSNSPSTQPTTINTPVEAPAGRPGMLAYISDPSLSTLSAAILERERAWNEANPRRWYISAETQKWVCAQRELDQVRYLTGPSSWQETQGIMSIQGEAGEEEDLVAALDAAFLEEKELDWLNAIDVSVFGNDHIQEEDESEDDDWYSINPLDPEGWVPCDLLGAEIIDKIDQFFSATSGLMTPVRRPIELASLSHSIDEPSSPTTDGIPIESGPTSNPAGQGIFTSPSELESTDVDDQLFAHSNHHPRVQATTGQGPPQDLERTHADNPLTQEDHLAAIRTTLCLPPTTSKYDIENLLIRNPSILHHLSDMTVPTPRLASQTSGRHSVVLKDVNAGLARLDLARSLNRVEWSLLDVRKALWRGSVPSGESIGPKMGKMGRGGVSAIRRRLGWKPVRTKLADSQTLDGVESSDTFDSSEMIEVLGTIEASCASDSD